MPAGDSPTNPVRRPSRTGAIVTLVIGIALVVVIAPVSFFGGLLWTALSASSIADELTPVAPSGGCDSLVRPRCDGLIWPRVRLAGVLTV